MRNAADEIAALRGLGRLYVVGDWKQIEAGVFDGRSFPPEQFVRQLRAEAGRLESQEKSKE
jgi:hypothetical protein